MLTTTLVLQDDLALKHMEIEDQDQFSAALAAPVFDRCAIGVSRISQH